MPSTGRRTGAGFALLFLVVVALAPGAMASTEATATPTTPEWVPFVSSRPVWCTMSNPGWSGCQGHHASPAIDIGMPIGTSVMAAGPGVVHAIDVVDSGPSGLFVAVAHADGTYSRYLHLSRVDVVVGQSVLRGQRVGLSGDTGSATAPHLHYDEQKPYGTRIDPGPMYGLVNGAAVEYPAALGQGSWWTVPYGSLLRNDAFPGIFLDVPDDHPSATDIEWAVDHDITDGYPDGTFRPGQPVNRQELVAFLHRLAGSPPGSFPDPGFADVPPGHPFRAAIHWAAATGITQGYPDGRFGTTDPVDRGSAAAFFFRLAGSPGGPFPDPGFTDVAPTHIFRTEIHWMAVSGITQGHPDGTYRPAEPVDRQSAAAFAHRAPT